MRNLHCISHCGHLIQVYISPVTPETLKVGNVYQIKKNGICAKTYIK